MAAAMDHVVDGPEGTLTESESEDDLARVTITTALDAGQPLRLVKLLAYGWSSQRTLPSVRDQVEAALSSAKRTGWDGLRRSQREYLDDVWDRADVELDGDPALQQAVRFSFFHVLQAAARAEQRAIPAKGLTGRGYDGHSFWDMDTFTVPVLTYTVPDAAADALRWRHSTLDLAEARAHELRLEGAAFPWRTIRGQECSGYWPAGTAALHVNADIADAVRRYLFATQDEAFEAGPALELLVATARLWRSVGHHDVDRRLPDRRRDRARRVHGADRQQRLHEPDGGAEPAHRRRPRDAPPASRRRRSASTRRRSRAGGTRPHAVVDPVRRGAARHLAVGGVHALPPLAVRAHDPAGLPAAPALPLLPAVHRPGRQAGRPRARAVAVRRPVRRRAEGARLRLLRAHHRPRLVALGVHPGDRRRRGRPPRPRLRLPGGDRVHRPARPRAQHPRRRAPRRARRKLARGGGRLRRHARPRRAAGLRAAAAVTADPARVPPHLPRAAPARRGERAAARATSCCRASRSSCCTTASRSR